MGSWPFRDNENPSFWDWIGSIILGIIVTVVTFYFIFSKGAKILAK
jgi:hypothetical protein